MVVKKIRFFLFGSTPKAEGDRIIEKDAVGISYGEGCVDSSGLPSLAFFLPHLTRPWGEEKRKRKRRRKRGKRRRKRRKEGKRRRRYRKRRRLAANIILIITL